MAKILVADDSDMMRKIARMSLQKGGHEIIEAKDGSEAVQLASSEMPQLVLLDAEMPVMDGWEASKAIKSDAKTSCIPVLMCTGHDLSEEADTLKACLADGYVIKPYNPDALLAKIQEAIEKKA